MARRWSQQGAQGRPDLRRVLATQVETVVSNEETQQRNKEAGAALLDRIGPAVVLTHSQSGAFGWLIADARPRLVKAIVAIEPAGPPFEATINGTGKAPPGDRRTFRSPMTRPSRTRASLRSSARPRLTAPICSC